MKAQTRQIIEDLKRMGINTSSIENQVANDPILDKQIDIVLGDGILRQAEFSRRLNSVDERERQLQKQTRDLATLHDASKTTNLPAEAIAAMKEMEQKLIETGLYDEESIKQVSFTGQNALKNMVIPDNVNNNSNQNNGGNKEGDMNNLDVNKIYVEAGDHRASVANMAQGVLDLNLELNAAIEEVKGLGIPVTRAKIHELRENLRTGFNEGLNLDGILEKTFKISEAVQKKTEADIDNRIKLETDKRVADILKEQGIPVNSRTSISRRHHPILDRKSINQGNVLQTNGNNKAAQDDSNKQLNNENLPRNKDGDVEIFRLRGTREQRMANAIDLNNKVEEHYANDITYVE